MDDATLSTQSARDEKKQKGAKRETTEKEANGTSSSNKGGDLDDQDMPSKSVGAWVEDAKANIDYIAVRHKALMSRYKVEEGASDANGGVHGMSHAEVKAICTSVGELLAYSRKAADGIRPKYGGRLREWWSGRCAEAAYKHMHYAEATLARLYNEQEIRSQVLDAVRRARAALADGDITRQVALMKLATGTTKICTSEELSEVIALGHEAADRNRSRLRAFRNVLIWAVTGTVVLLSLFVALAWYRPWLVPLCFIQDPSVKPPPQIPMHICPSGAQRLRLPAPSDVFIVAVLGVVGGAMSAGVFVRGIYGDSKPYDVSVPLALLKIPVGGFSAVIGILLLSGDFIPGFSAVDTQNQVLAYAVVFGFAQQILTKWLDDRAEALVASVPSKARGATGQSPSPADDLAFVAASTADVDEGSSAIRGRRAVSFVRRRQDRS